MAKMFLIEKSFAGGSYDAAAVARSEGEARAEIARLEAEIVEQDPFDLESFLEDWREGLQDRGVSRSEAHRLYPSDVILDAARTDHRARALEPYRFHVRPIRVV